MASFFISKGIKKGDVTIEVALQYNDTYNESVLTFANDINTMEGGTHEAGFKSAITKAINDFFNFRLQCRSTLRRYKRNSNGNTFSENQNRNDKRTDNFLYNRGNRIMISQAGFVERCIYKVDTLGNTFIQFASDNIDLTLTNKLSRGIFLKNIKCRLR